MINKEKTNIILTISAWIFIAILFFAFHKFQLDDAYITYRYALNLSKGLGFSYNPPQIVFGTTTPLYTLILALFSWINLDIVISSLILCWFGQSLVVWVFINSKEAEGWGLLFLVGLLILIPGSYLILGMETSFYTGISLLCLYQASKKYFTTAVILSTIVTLTRYDGIVLVGVVLLFEWFSTHKPPFKSFFLFVAIVMPWLLYANWAFDSVLPNTFFAKAGGANNQNIFVNGIGPQLSILLFFMNVSISVGHVISAIIFLLLFWCAISTDSNFGRLMSAWAILYLFAYSVIGLRYDFHWYYYPVIPSILVSVKFCLQTISKKIKNTCSIWSLQQMPFLAIGLPIFLATFLGFLALSQQGPHLASIGGRQIVYPLAAKWICDHSDKDATVLVPEIGIIGWFCDRTIIDPYGLVTPEMIPYIKRGNPIEGEVLMRPDFIIIPNFDKNEENPAVPFASKFQDKYRVAEVITDVRYPYQLVIFEKVH